MGAVQLPDHLKRVIDQQVAAGRASSETAFLEQAILRLAQELEAEDDIVAVAEEGIAAVSRGDCVTVASPETPKRFTSGPWRACAQASPPNPSSADPVSVRRTG